MMNFPIVGLQERLGYEPKLKINQLIDGSCFHMLSSSVDGLWGGGYVAQLNLFPAIFANIIKSVE